MKEEYKNCIKRHPCKNPAKTLTDPDSHYFHNNKTSELRSSFVPLLNTLTETDNLRCNKLINSNSIPIYKFLLIRLKLTVQPHSLKLCSYQHNINKISQVNSLKL